MHIGKQQKSYPFINITSSVSIASLTSASIFKNFSKLGLDEKRNKYSEEMIKVALLLKSFLNQRQLELIDAPYNYKSGEDKKMTESDLLNINFRDLYILKTELLMLINYINEIESRCYNGRICIRIKK